ncbi:MAG: class I SAM-dependent methyltransferase [Verrucomicrobiae bacterium]|nr:class I SAM-dependent methyltransferase [Verrucomicrobiae bacterium]
MKHLRHAIVAAAWAVSRAFLRVLPARALRAFLTECARNPDAADRAGFHVRRAGFSEPLPDFTALEARDFESPRWAHGLDWRDATQEALLRKLAKRVEELDALETEAAPFRFDNGFYGGADAAAFFLLLRDLKPRRLVEVGSGFSTRVAQAALRRNAREGAPAEEHVCLEPFPNERTAGLSEGVRFLRSAAEDAPEELFLGLRGGDVLFVDSSHTVRPFGDVPRLVLDLLPRLHPGVWVHFHDIFLPWDYPRTWVVRERRIWTEQYLLEAFLSENPNLEIVLAMYRLHRAADMPLRALGFRDGIGHPPCAFWMRRRETATS